MEEIQGYKFGIDLDDGGMTRSLKELRNEAKLLKAAMKSNFTEIRSGEGIMQAYTHKVKDADKAIEGQKAVVSKLREQQKGLDLQTEKGRSAYVRYENQINRAKTEISNLSAQQERAKKSADLFRSGVLDVQRSVKLAAEANKAYVERLQAEGRTDAALSAKHKGLRDSYDDINKELTIEKRHLNEVAEASGKGSDEYRKQSIRVNELGSKLAHLRTDLSEVRAEDDKLHPTGINRMIAATDKATKRADKADHLFGKMFAANFLGNGLVSAWQNVTAAIGGAIKAGAAFDMSQQKMGATWQTLTGSIAKAKDMVKTINKYSVATGQDTDLVDELQQGFYHLHSNKHESDKMTRSTLNLADAVGINKQQSLAVRQDMVNGLSKGTVQQGLLNQTSQYFPMFREALAKQLTHEIKTGESQYGTTVTDPKTKKKHTEMMKSVDVSDLPTMTKAGLISSKEFEKTFEHLGLVKYKQAADNMMKTMYGMQRTIKARVPALLGDMEKPIINAKNPIYEGVSKWVSDPRTEKEFTKVGKAANSGIGVITKAFAKAFGIKSAPQAMDRAMNSLAKGVTNASKSIARNAPEIKDLFTTLKSLGGIGFKTLIESLKIVNFLLKPLIKMIGGSADTFAKFAATWFLASKGLKAFNQGLKTVRGFQDLFGKATEIFGLKKETTAIDEETAALNRNSRARAENSDSGIGGGTGSSKTAGAEGALEDVAGGGTGKEAKELTRVEKYGSKRGIGRLTSKLHGLGEFKNVTKAGKMLAGSVGAFDVINAGTDLLGTTKKTVGSHVGAASGSLGGTAAGAAIGTAIMPGIGTAIGAGLGGLTGESIGRKFGKAIQKGLTFQKIHVPKISDDTAYDKLNKTARNHYKDMIKGDKQNLKLLYKNGDITKSEYEKRLAIIQKNESKMTRISSMNEKDRSAVTKYYAQSRQALTEKWNRKILTDQKKYGKNSKQVTKDEADKKKSLNKQELKFATQVTGKEARLHTTLTGKIKLASNKQVTILKKLESSKKKLSKKQLEQAVANSNKERKTVTKNASKQASSSISSANKKYWKTVAAAKSEYKGNTKYAKDQRKKIEEHARKQRDNAIAAAYKQQKDTVKKAKDQYDDTVDYAHKQNKGVTKQSAAQFENTKKNNKKSKDNYDTTWHGIWKTVGNWAGKLIGGLNKSVIKGQNKVFSQYGGTNTLSPISAAYFASGTGAFSNMRRAITKPTLSVLNDGHDSPETGNQEAVLHPNGLAELVKGTNTMKMLEPGAEVLNASETKLMSQLGLMHFSGGTGLFSGLFKTAGKVGNFFKKAFGSLKDKLKAISGFTKDSTKSFNSVFNPDFGKLKGTVAKSYAHLANSKVKKQGQKWWSAAWNVIDGAANSSGGGGPVRHSPGAGWTISSGFGYRGKTAGGMSSHDGVDFTNGKVVHALQDAIVTEAGAGRWLGSDGVGEVIGTKGGKLRLIYQELNGKSPKGATLLVHKGDHVKQGQAIAKLGPSGTHVHIGATTEGLWDHGGSSTKGWLDVTKLHGSFGNKAAKKVVSGLSKFATKQLKHSGVLSWVKKFLAPLTEATSSSGSGDAPAPTGSRKHWMQQAGMPKSWWNAINTIVTQESGWRLNAANGQYHGLPQTTIANLEKGGKNWRTNAVAQLRAMKKYISGRYGTADKALAFRNSHNWYANGGLSVTEKLAHISEHNMPEMIIPMSQLKKSRGYELLGKTAAMMAKRDGMGNESSQAISHDDSAIKKLSSKLDSVIKLLGELVSGQHNPIPAVVRSSDVVQVINQHNKQSRVNRNLGRGTPFG
ncbi:tape measure protein [Levilactobacillus sp. N40-8-2]|uniref:aggregation-promoting factor C-terminal-like domain-containing protein n=1 Tax=Levilactobacillus muriae TaxID=3238987 RepID=UPI0038B2D4F5